MWILIYTVKTRENGSLKVLVIFLFTIFLYFSKECIDESKTCDGKNDCEDGSDENIPQCSSSVPLQGDGQGEGTVIIGVIVGIVAIIIIIAIIAYSIHRYVL